MRTKKCYIIFQLGGKKLCGHLTNWSALSIPSGWDNDEILPTDFYCGKMEGDGLNLNSFGCGPDGSLLESQYALSSHGSTGRFFALKFQLLTTSISALNGLPMTRVVQILVCRIDFWNLFTAAQRLVLCYCRSRRRRRGRFAFLTMVTSISECQGTI